MRIETRRLDELRPDPKNPRVISQSQMAALSRSLERWGLVEPLVVNKDGTIIGGHQRYDALRQIGVTETPCVIVDLPSSDARALNIALNRISGEWDEPKLAILLKELKAGNVDLSLTGFEEIQLAQLLAPDLGGGLTDPDVLPENIEAMTKSGDVWALGEHRVVCGDATNAELVFKTCGGFPLLVTSPPYFNQREYSQWKTYDDYLATMRQTVKAWDAAASSSSLMAVNIGSDEQARRWMPSDWWALIRDHGRDWLYRECIAWVKAAAVWSVPRSMHIENGHYFPAQRWEVILVVSRGDHPSFDISDRDRVREFQENVWNMAVVPGQVQTSGGHPAMYPVELPRRLIMAYSKKGLKVFDPFLGSGTTLIAAEQLGRICHGIEIEPRYVDVSVARWERFTGRSATRL